MWAKIEINSLHTGKNLRNVKALLSCLTTIQQSALGSVKLVHLPGAGKKASAVCKNHKITLIL